MKDGKALTKQGKSNRVPPSRLNLSKIGHIRAELARLYRDARRGKVALSDATRLAYLLQVMGRMIVDHEFEKRIESLEQGGKDGKDDF